MPCHARPILASLVHYGRRVKPATYHPNILALARVSGASPRQVRRIILAIGTGELSPLRRANVAARAQRRRNLTP